MNMNRVAIKHKKTLSARDLVLLIGMVVISFFVVKTNSISSTTTRTILVAVSMLAFIALLYTHAFRNAINSSVCVAFFLFILLVIPMSALEYGVSSTIGAVLSQITYFMGIIFSAVIIFNRDNKKLIKMLFYSIMLVWIYENIQLMLLCFAYPNIGRLIASHDANYSLISSVGSPYGIAQSTCLISIVILKFITDRKYKIPLIIKGILIATLVVFTITIYQTQSTITSLILIAGYVVALSYNLLFNNEKKKSKGIAVVIVLLIISTYFFKNELGAILISSFNSSNSVFGIRMVEIGRLLVGSNTSHDMQTRGQLFYQSWSSIWKHPLMGNYYNGGSVSGDHCHFLDVLSDYGLLMGIPNLLIFYFFEKDMTRKIENYDRFAWLPMLLMSLMNPMRMYQVYFVVLFIIPLCYLYFFHYKVNCDNTQ